MIRLPRSATARFVLLYLALSVAGIIPVFFYIYQQTDRAVVHVFRERIDDQEANLLAAQRTEGIAGVASEISGLIRSGAAAHGVLLLVGPNGRRIAGNISEWPPTLQRETDWTQMRLFRDGHEQSELFALSTTQLPSGHRRRGPATYPGGAADCACRSAGARAAHRADWKPGAASIDQPPRQRDRRRRGANRRR